jgi:signal transduction histidine kinase
MKKGGEKIIMEISTHNIIYKGKKAVLAIGNNVTEKIQLENDLHEERLMNQKLITEAVLTGQEKERAELGEELHDNINQILASTRLYIECAIADENIRKDLLGKGKTLLDTAMKEIRKLSRTLLPPSLGDVSLLEALSELTNDSLQVNPIEIKKKWKNFNEEGLCQKLKLTIFRIAQEQMNNIYKHSQAKNVTISLSKTDGTILLVIKDDGIGFDTQTKRAGVGIRNITSRAEVNNGTVSIESSPGQGCKLMVQFLIKA